VEYASSSKTFKKRITRNSLQLRQGKIRCGALIDPQNSAFQCVFNSQQDDVLITLCGFDFASFETMHCRFKILFDNLSPYHSHGRLIAKHNKKKSERCLITSYQCLALVLAWTRTQGSFAVLQIIFGMTAGCLSLWLRFGGRLLIQILRNDEHSRPTSVDANGQ
jgi:hypothetical protein